LFSKVLEKNHASFGFDRDSKFKKGQKMQKPVQCQKLRFFQKKISQKFYFLPEMIKHFKLTENIEKKIFDPYPTLP
jgi:hypothetical protein